LWTSAFFSNLPAELEELFEGAKNYPYIGAGLFAGLSRVMMHAFLCNRVALSDGPGENLGIDQGARADHCDVVKYFSFVQLEGTINITNPHPKQQADELGPAPGINLSDEVVLAVETVATDNIILLNQRQQRGHFCDIELAVTISVEDKPLRGGPEARLQRCAVAEIGGMVHDSYSFVLGGDFVGNAARGIGTSVVNDNYLKVHPELLQDRKCLLGGTSNVVLLVVAREKDAY
jgi:hypothetical protein